MLRVSSMALALSAVLMIILGLLFGTAFNDKPVLVDLGIYLMLASLCTTVLHAAIAEVESTYA